MAYATLSDSQIDGDSPLIADTLFKLRDNPIAIANGDPGAPRIVQGALALPGAGTVLLQAWSDAAFGLSFASEGSALTSGTGYQLVPFASVGVSTDNFVAQRDGTISVRVGINRTSGSNPAYARVYRNGVAYGSVQTVTTSGLQLFFESLDFVAGDSIQLYGDRNGNESVGYLISIYGGYYDPAAVRFGS